MATATDAASDGNSSRNQRRNAAGESDTEGSSDESYADSAWARRHARPIAPAARRECPYLDTVTRNGKLAACVAGICLSLADSEERAGQA